MSSSYNTRTIAIPLGDLCAMSESHPIVAVTGSSGAGTTSVKLAFEHIFAREGIIPAIIEGDSFHRHARAEMEWEVEKAALRGHTLTHFGPDGNLWVELEALFQSYAETGTGQRRHYVHTDEEARVLRAEPGTFTDWTPLAPNTDLLFYEGLHGALVTDDVDIARFVDLRIGVVPIINLEWIQKIQRDRAVRGYSAEAATAMILSRMPDYVHYICPQFSHTDVNFQRVPTVDTSNPFTSEEIPTSEQSMVVIHVANQEKITPDYRHLLDVVDGAFMSQANTLVVPAGKMVDGMEFLLNPVIERMRERRDLVRKQSAA